MGHKPAPLYEAPLLWMGQGRGLLRLLLIPSLPSSSSASSSRLIVSCPAGCLTPMVPVPPVRSLQGITRQQETRNCLESLDGPKAKFGWETEAPGQECDPPKACGRLLGCAPRLPKQVSL